MLILGCTLRTILIALAALSAWPASAQAQRVVTGVARWADVRGNPHPVRGADVQLLDADRNVALATARTDEAGAYRIPLAAPGVRSVSVVVRAASPFTSVADTMGRPYEMRTGPQPVPAGTQDVVMPEIKGAATPAANQAFGMVDAIAYGAEFRRRRMGAPPPPLAVVFPVEGKVSRFQGGRLFVTGVNGWDWDVVLHEYGHYVARLDTMTDTLGGDHFLNKPITGEKGKAVRLAWTEGWASWFSIAAQQEGALIKLGIPGAGDASYRDSGLDTTVSLDDPTDPPWSLGERSEVTVMRVLHDLSDDHGGKPAETVAMGADSLWRALRRGRPECLWDAWKVLGAGLSPAERAGAAGILEAQGAAPAPLRPIQGAVLGGAVPRFTWKQNGAPRVVVTVFSAADSVLYTSPPVKDAFFKPTAADWARVRAGAAGGPVFWRVDGSDPNPPATGPYPGTRRTLTP